MCVEYIVPIDIHLTT